MFLLSGVKLAQRLVVAVFVAAHFRVLRSHFEAHVAFILLIEFGWFDILHVTSFVSDIVSFFK